MNLFDEIKLLEEGVKSGLYGSRGFSGHSRVDGVINPGVINPGLIEDCAIKMMYIGDVAEIKVKLMGLSGEIYERAMDKLDAIHRIHRERNSRRTA